VDRFDDPNQMGECRRTLGKNSYEGNIRQIVIRNDLSKRALVETLLHELLHAVEYEYKLPIPHQLIHKLEKPLLRILLLNGWISFDD
jgi:hypothetical protein